jgi:hypothetical protein
VISFSTAVSMIARGLRYLPDIAGGNAFGCQQRTASRYAKGSQSVILWIFEARAAGTIVIDPYDILGVDRNASDDAIKAAYRHQAKSTHPDSGGSAEAFLLGQKALELLLDPLRRKVFDATGYDPELADPTDLQGLLVIEKLVNDIVLDEREPGTFDPLARMRASLSSDIRKARFHVSEMQGHGLRIERHIQRLGTRPATDILGYMLRARIEAISKAILESNKQIEATERALKMLETYSYEMNRENDEPNLQSVELDRALFGRRK